jgi:HEAT repeat protein
VVPLTLPLTRAPGPSGRREWCLQSLLHDAKPHLGHHSARERIEAGCARRGKEAVAADCIALLEGESNPELLRSLAGPGAEKFFDGAEHKDTYWFRVWALRGLLWSWDSRAGDSVCEALSDDSWRVREMAAKVVAKHLVGEASSAVAELRDDPVPRVRTAAERALIRLSDGDA